MAGAGSLPSQSYRKNTRSGWPPDRAIRFFEEHVRVTWYEFREVKEEWSKPIAHPVLTVLEETDPGVAAIKVPDSLVRDDAWHVD